MLIIVSDLPPTSETSRILLGIHYSKVHFELPVDQSRMIVHIASSHTILSASLISPLFYCQFPDGMNKAACCDTPTPALSPLPGASLFGNFFLTAGGTGGKHLRVTCSFHVDIVYNVD